MRENRGFVPARRVVESLQSTVKVPRMLSGRNPNVACAGRAGVKIASR